MPTSRQLPKDLRVDPERLLALHAALPERYPAYLESAAQSAGTGAYDILFAFPGRQLTLYAEELCGRNFLDELDAWYCAESSGQDKGEGEGGNGDGAGSADEGEDAGCSAHLPFTGGWLLFLGYELAQEIEPSLRLPPGSGIVAQAIRIPAAVVHDRAVGATWIVAESAELLDVIEADLQGVSPAVRSGADDGPLLSPPGLLESPPENFLLIVATAIEHIAAGDIYQANLSREWRGQLLDTVDSIEVHRRLRSSNPGGFAGIVRLGDRTIVSSSPERLVRTRGRHVSTRPIAGTRRRGQDARSDSALSEELRAHPKERAEHIMLLDLERNDLGRVCEPGTVVVDEYMGIESYAHVHHIVSNVSGRLLPATTPGEVIRAVFPGGTITGCPKVKCMQIIADLERTPRGTYTGSLGYLNLNGDLDLNILIRTLEIRDRNVTFRAGAGIVADSVPERELDETRAKARGLQQALEGGRPFS